METLSIRLLGTVEIRLGEEPVTGFVSSKAQALLFYLAVVQRPVARATLATLLWGDWGETAARRSLSKALSNLRQLVGKYLQIERQTVAFRGEQPYWLDVTAFTAVLATAESAPADTAIADLQKAVALYQGEFLAGFYVDTAPDFEAWVRTEREQLHQRCHSALTCLIRHMERAADLNQAIGYTHQLLQWEPTDEEAHRRLMVLYLRNGQRSSALAQYELCREILAAELDVEPAAETTALYQRIRQGTDNPYKAASPYAIASHRTPALDLATTIAPFSSIPQRTSEAPTGATAQRSDEPPLIGRQAIQQQIVAEWQQTVANRPHFCLIHGEAGIGKTRLAEEVLRWVETRGVAVARARAYAAAGELAHAPLIDWLRSPPLQAAVATLEEVWLTELARLLPELTTAQPRERPHPAWSAVTTDSQWQRRRLFDALVRAFQAGTTPKLLLLDDLQWCDRETLAWLHYFLQTAHTEGENIPRTSAPLLIIATARPEILHEAHPFMPMLLHLRSMEAMTEIALEPLDATASATLAQQVSTQPLTPAQITKLYHYTEGNPLFVIETLRTTAWQELTQAGPSPQPARGLHTPPDDGTDIGGQPHLPAKVQAVIQERLAQLSSRAYRLAGLAAVIGRSFELALLQQAGAEREDEVVAGLDELWQQGIVRAHGPQRYDFSHDRIREVAYLAVGPVQRPLWHRRVAEALEDRHSADLTPVSAQLAFHWEEVGEVEEAIDYYRQAATKAHELFADADAFALLQQALELVETLPDTTQTRKLELDILLQLKHPLIISQGFTPRLGKICNRAKALCEQVGTAHELYDTLSGLRTFHHMRAEYKAARMACEMMIALSKKIKNAYSSEVSKTQGLLSAPVVAPRGEIAQWEAAGNQLLGTTLLYQGELETAQHKFQTAFATGMQSVGLFIFSSMNLWLLGYPQQARQNMLQAWFIAKRSQNPYDMGFAMANLARLNHILRRDAQTELWAAKTIELSMGYEIPFWPRLGRVLLGRVLAAYGETERGISLLQTTLQAMDIDQHFAFRTYFTALLAEAYASSEQYREALTQLSTAMEFCERNGERFWHAELVRLQGEYQLALGAPPAEVIACYEEAIAIAQAQQAKSLELRATVSLARLWQQQGREEAALARLAKLYNWFTEGFNTADLRAAKALLKELGDSGN